MEKKITYFESAGKINTVKCAEIAAGLLRDRIYKSIVIASTSGITGRIFGELLKDFPVNKIVVTQSFCFKKPFPLEISGKFTGEIKILGVRGFNEAIKNRVNKYPLADQSLQVSPLTAVFESYNFFCPGMKVCAKIVMEACDAGLILEDEKVVAVAGTREGADTVVVIRAKPWMRFKELKFLEISAMPGNFIYDD